MKQRLKNSSKGRYCLLQNGQYCISTSGFILYQDVFYINKFAFREFMLASALTGQTSIAETNTGRPKSPQPPLPVVVPGLASSSQGQPNSEPLPQIRPHPERIARKLAITIINIFIAHLIKLFHMFCSCTTKQNNPFYCILME